MTTTINLALSDLTAPFIAELKQKFGKATNVELRFEDKNSTAEALFSEADFWAVIEKIDWSKKSSASKIAPAVKMLAKKPVSSICLFADKLSEKLYALDTRKHATQYAANEPENFISADDFLYARCAVIAEGRAFFETVKNEASEMPDDIVFEPLLTLAHDAFELKMGIAFNYVPTHSYETRSNESGWKQD